MPDAPIAALVDSISDAEAAFHAATPNLLDQLELRSWPLIEQWNARGPGIFTRLTAITKRTLAVESADVVLVYPALGGCGVAHLPYNSVRIEAVLAYRARSPGRNGGGAWGQAASSPDKSIFENLKPRIDADQHG